MLTTTGFQNLGFEVLDTTVSILPGVARIGSKLLPFDGTRSLFSALTDFEIETNVYQNTLLYLQNVDDITDMTQVRSDTTSSYESLDIPSLPADASGHYSPEYPLGVLTFFKDASGVSLVSYN